VLPNMVATNYKQDKGDTSLEENKRQDSNGNQIHEHIGNLGGF